MSSLAIVSPVALTALSGSAGFARLITPNPKEAVFVAAGQTATVIVDAGRVVTVDSYFCGYHGENTDAGWSVLALADAAGNTVTATPVNGSAAPLGLGPPWHSFAQSAPLQSRYFRFSFNGGSTGNYVGVFALGRAFAPTWGTEWGAGRIVEDTGTVERLFGGGFGIDDGVATGGYSWTFGDLTKEETRALYQLVKDRRTTRSLLVVEDPEQSDGLNERLHWGLLRKLDQYERLDPVNTKWSLQIQDWA